MKLAIVCSHPIQYYAPWFKHLASDAPCRIKVFYLWDFGTKPTLDIGFQREFAWDIPLLDGYNFEFVPNCASRPGTDRLLGLVNPSLAARVAQFAPDAILLFGYRYWSHVSLLLSPRFFSTPFLLRGDSHRLGLAASNLGRLKDGLRGLAFSRLSSFLYVGTANKAYYEIVGIPPHKLFFAPHAVDNDRFGAAMPAAEDDVANARHELGLSEDNVVVLFSGKFEAKKRPDLLIEAFKRVTWPHARLVLQGSGPMENMLRGMAEDPRIRWMPFQNQSKMPQVYSLADLAVLPSEGPGETWGLCVNEAMCMSRAVAVSDHVGCGPDLVHASENGWVFPAGNAAALAAVLQEACADRGRLGRYGMRSFDIVKHYSYREATGGLMAALDYCLKSRAGGRR